MSRGRLFFLVALAALLLGGAALWQRYAAENNGSAALARGLAALDRDDARTARVELLNAMRADPRSIAARTGMATALAELGDGAGAQAEVERIRKLGDAPGRTRHLMAQARLLQGDAAGALREASAGDVAPGYAVKALRVAARAAMEQDDDRVARASLERALAAAPDDPENWIALSRYRMAIGDQAGAIGAADRAVTIAPDDVAALVLRGDLAREQYGLMAALPLFERALALRPDSVPTLLGYAALLADSGQAGKMLAATRRVLGLEPGNARALMMQAVMAARAGRSDLARSLLDRTQGRLDGEPATMLLRGVLHLDAGNPTLAAKSLGALVEAQPDNRTARTLLGRAFYEGGDYASAANVLTPMVTQGDAQPYVLTLAARAQEALGNRAMAGDMLARAAWPVRAAATPFAAPGDAALADRPPPGVGTARDNIPYIRALLTTGRIDEAVDRARALSDANRGAPAAYVVLGDALDAAGRPGDAARAYETAANMRFSREVALRLAGAWMRAGNPQRAIQVVQLFLSQNPVDVEAQRLAASAYMQAQDWRRALTMLAAVRAQVGGNDAVLMADMARAALETGDGAKARAYAAHAYRLMPGNPVTADIYGWTLLRTGKAGQSAVDLLEKAVALAPRHPVLRMHLGQAYAAVGRKGEAQVALRTAIGTGAFPGREQAVEALAAL